jgi:cytochrome c oxidase assembly factor CtaG/polyferredoxin
MENALNAAFASWTIPPWATFFLALTALIYARGWSQIRRTRPEQFPPWRLLCFLSGVLTVWLAIASPLDALGGMLLVVHMTQHLLLMSIAPPLIALSAPQVPLLRGLPRALVREGLGPLFTLPAVHALEWLLKSRLFAWVAMNVAFLGWHLPAAYDLALAHPVLHEVEHACFLLTSILFWWPVIEPWPVRYKGSRWMLLPYLMSADIVNTALSAYLSFSGRVIYPVYADVPRLFGVSALSDQVAAGSLMWVLGSTVFLVPVMWVTLTQLSRRAERRQAARALAVQRASAERRAAAGPGFPQPIFAGVSDFSEYARSLFGSPSLFPAAVLDPPPVASRAAAARPAGPPRLDLFTLPAIGAFFRSRYGRQSLQAVMLLAASAIVVDGFFGHQMSSMNLAGVVPWTYARALFVLGLLLVGNLFCMSCPFMLPRELAKKIASALGFARLPWPRRLRGKWLSAVLLGLFFWAYEAFALWDSPLRTASVLAAYFLTALTLDSVFRGASFCKYVCPLGQFNFVSSLLSPVTLQARSQAVCTSCSTRDCIAGNEQQRGCELDLYMPLKSGNLDCTLCMDCVKACPHDNIGLFVEPPARELVQIAQWDPPRSSVGRYSRRADVAALALIVVAAAFASAAVMVAPVALLLDRASRALPVWLAPTAGLALAAAAPAALLGLLLAAVLVMRGPLERRARASMSPEEASAGRARGAADTSLGAQLCRWALALLPAGLGMWAAHLCFHLATAWGALLPALQQAGRDLHLHWAAAAGWAGPGWATAPGMLTPDSLLQLQLGLLDAGMLGALYLGWRMVSPSAGAPGQSRARVLTGLPSGSRPGPLSASTRVPQAKLAVAGAARTGMADAARSVSRAATTLHEQPVAPIPSIGGSLLLLAPWAAVVLLLYAAGVWVLLEPMQMRGMMGM